MHTAGLLSRSEASEGAMAVKQSREEGPYYMVLDQRIGRILVFEERAGREVLVGSMPGDASEADMQEIRRRLEAEGRK